MYNAESSIIRALDSLKNQTYRVFEIIVVNDGSTDNSRANVEEYCLRNPNINIILINQLNGGVSKARNAGLKIANGEYIAFLDSDDEWVPSKLEIQLKVFQLHTECSFLGGLINDPATRDKGKLKKIELKALMFKNYFQPSTVILKRDIVKKIGFFDENQRYAEEGNYFMRIADRFVCILLFEKVVLFDQGKRGFGESGLSANLKEMEKGELKNIKFAYKQRYISFYIYAIAVIFSILKYFRRILIVNLWR